MACTFIDCVVEAIRKCITEANAKRDQESTAQDTSHGDDVDEKTGPDAQGSDADDDDTATQVLETQLSQQAKSGGAQPNSISPRTSKLTTSTSTVSSSADGMPTSQVPM